MKFRTLVVPVLVVLSVACSGGSRDRGVKSGTNSSPNSDSGVDNRMTCADGQIRCEGNDKLVCQDGSYQVEETCADGCTAGLGCTACSPTEASCDGDVSRYCSGDGSEVRKEVCDAAKGLSCNASTGRCDGVCSEASLGRSYVGCEYYALQSSNAVLNRSRFNFAIVIANTSSNAGKITISGGALSSPRILAIEPDGVLVEKLPWIDSVHVQGPAFVAGGAYRIRSNVPVTAYQFNPLEYTDGSSNSYTNDASLLLPTNVYDTTYRLLSWPADGSFSKRPAVAAYMALNDGTTVQVTGGSGIESPASAGTINAGDLVQISSDSDLSGALVTADGPIQVIAGHVCTNVPRDVAYCDHLEESMFPTSAIGKKYVAAAPALPSLPEGKVRVVRIQAIEDNTTLTYSPADIGGATTIAHSGGFIEIPLTRKDFVVEGDKPIVVAQFMAGSQAGGNNGDPALTLAVPVEQYRQEYLFHAPTNYETSYANIVRPAGVDVTLDGAPVEGFTPVGDGSYEVVRAGLSNDGNGNHRIDASAPVGVSVYGYGQDTSYWYPGGLDLKVIGPR